MIFQKSTGYYLWQCQTLERDGAISKTRFDKNTNSVIGKRVRDILLHAPKHIPGTRDGKPARFKDKLIQKFEANRGR